MVTTSALGAQVTEALSSRDLSEDTAYVLSLCLIITSTNSAAVSLTMLTMQYIIWRCIHSDPVTSVLLSPLYR